MQDLLWSGLWCILAPILASVWHQLPAHGVAYVATGYEINNTKIIITVHTLPQKSLGRIWIIHNWCFMSTRNERLLSRKNWICIQPAPPLPCYVEMLQILSITRSKIYVYSLHLLRKRVISFWRFDSNLIWTGMCIDIVGRVHIGECDTQYLCVSVL